MQALVKLGLSPNTLARPFRFSTLGQRPSRQSRQRKWSFLVCLLIVCSSLILWRQFSHLRDDERSTTLGLLPQIESDLSTWKEDGVDFSLLYPFRKVPVTTVAQACWIIDNEPRYINYHPKNMKKAQKFDRHLRSVLERTKVPDVFFLLNYDSKGKENNISLSEAHAPPRPVFSISKTVDHKDILYPNMYFDDLNEWESLSDDLLAFSRSIKWENKRQTAFWRGFCGEKYTGTKPRLELMKLWQDPRLAISFTNKCPLHAYPKFVNLSLEEQRIISDFPLSPQIPQRDFAFHKYLINMPGQASGSYSRNLQTIMPLNTTIIMWDMPWKEFYYSGLRQGLHYVHANEGTLLQTVQWLRTHDDAARAIAIAASKFFEDNLVASKLVQYWKELLDRYAPLQNFDPRNIPDPSLHYSDFCSCGEKSAENTRCGFCDLK